MNITINGTGCAAAEGETILKAARRNGVDIPTLCYHEAFGGRGHCRLCLVEVVESGKKKVVASCTYKAAEGMEVITHSEKIKGMRKTLLKLLSQYLPDDGKITRLKREYGLLDKEGHFNKIEDKCILCGLCVEACSSLGTSCISIINRGIHSKISTPHDEPSSNCIGCMSCANICPTSNIKTVEKPGVRRIWGKDFELLKCPICGAYFATEEEWKHMNEKLDYNLHMQCEKCKRHLNAEKIKSVFGKQLF